MTPPSPAALPLEVDPDDVHALLAREDPDFVLLDVREPWEYEIVRLPGSLLLPMAVLPAHAGDLDRAWRVIALCHHGVRSLAAARWLRRMGFGRAQSLHGGIDAYAERCEPALARY